ncbi:MAG: hypothetical protein ABIX19_01495 [Gemmatimonadaceae bacterium]
MAGCSTAADGYVTAPATALHSSANAGHHVTGSGHVPIGMTDDLREFTFHAIEHPDGSVTGSYKVERTDTGAYFIVDVTCMSVVKNTAWIAGRISETNTASVRVGTVSYFWAEDGGEGADAQDIVSNARINDRDGADVDFCNTRPTRLAPLRVEMGNVQIR